MRAGSAFELYLALAVVGTALPLSAFLPWFAEHGLDLPAFVAELFSTRIGAFFGWDVIVSALALFVFIAVEGRRTGVRHRWLSHCRDAHNRCVLWTAVVSCLAPAGARAAMIDFAYHRSVAPMMWVLVAIACVELVVVHMLVALWKPWVALALSLVSLGGLVWLIGVIRSFPRLPVRIGDGRLLMRVGTLRGIEIPLSAIAGLRKSWDAAAIKHRSVLNLAMIAYPNIVVDLREPIMAGGPMPRPVIAVAHRLDDPAAFAATLEQLGRAHDP